MFLQPATNKSAIGTAITMKVLVLAQKAARLSAALIVPCLIMVANADAVAQSSTGAQLQQVEDRLYRLERDVEGLIRLGGSGGGAPIGGGMQTDAAAHLSVRLSTLENEIANLTGLLEELRHQINVEHKTAEKARADVEFRLRALETRNGHAHGGPALGGPALGGPALGGPALGGPSLGSQTGGGSAGGPALGGAGQLPPDDLFGDGAAGGPGDQSTGGSAGQLPPGTDVIGGGAQSGSGLGAAPELQQVPQLAPKPLYQRAMQHLAERDYGQAEASFSAFLERYPDHLLAGNAQYWLGESYYARNDYKQAAAAFLAGVRNYPDSKKAPGAMLKLAMSLDQLGHKAQACATLVELKARHTDLSAKIKARIGREEQAMSCR